MDKEYYTNRISKAGPVGLVALNFEITLDFLLKARKMYNTDVTESRHCIIRAKEGIENLIQSLDFEVPLSFDFYEIYKYLYGILSDAHASGDAGKAIKTLDEVIEHMESFSNVWKQLAENTAEEPIRTDGAPKIYAGLTYGKDGKAAEYIDEPATGYKA